jgi:hypothetical protein
MIAVELKNGHSTLLEMQLPKTLWGENGEKSDIPNSESEGLRIRPPVVDKWLGTNGEPLKTGAVLRRAQHERSMELIGRP